MSTKSPRIREWEQKKKRIEQKKNYETKSVIQI